MFTPQGDRKNDVRQTIQTLRAGDLITESFLASITQALNERRPFSNPPTQIYRQPVTGGPTKFASRCYINRATPTTNNGLNSTVQVFSDTANSYDGTTNAQKAIFNFENPVTIPAGKYAQIVFGQFINGSFPNVGASISAAQWSASAFSGAPTFALNLRVRAITAAFVTASQNWNNFGSLTLGATVGTYQVSALTNSGGSSQFIPTSTYFFYPPNSDFDIWAGGALTAYGFVLDAQLTTSNATISGSNVYAAFGGTGVTPRLINV